MFLLLFIIAPVFRGHYYYHYHHYHNHRHLRRRRLQGMADEVDHANKGLCHNTK